MKTRLLTATFVVLGTLALPITAARAQTANGPYYATPSWDQTLPARSRFIVLSNMNNAPVLDRETGLVWERSPDLNGFTRDWPTAQLFCNNKNVGGRKGWRMATVQELQSLVDPTQAFPALPSGHPFNVGSPFATWSATISIAAPAFAPNSTRNAWAIDFEHGDAFIDQQSDAFQATRCVRSGQGVDSQ